MFKTVQEFQVKTYAVVGKGITEKDGWCLMIDLSAENAERIYAEEIHEIRPGAFQIVAGRPRL